MSKTVGRMALFAALALAGCAVSDHGVFPKLVWYWSTDAQQQREHDRQQEAARKAYQQSLSTNQVAR